MAAIHLRKIRDLHIKRPTRPGRMSSLVAASGLVQVGKFLYVVADDENHIGAFEIGSQSPGTTFRILPGILPHTKKARKKLKADLEILTFVPKDHFADFGALLCIPSGSKKNRSRGVLLPVGVSGELTGKHQRLDFAGIFASIAPKVGEFNLEGALVKGEEIWTFHRGDIRQRKTYAVRINLSHFLEAARHGKTLKKRSVVSEFSFEIPERLGLRFTLTDATLLPSSKIMFTAAAEFTDNSYDDAPHGGSGIGILSAEGKLEEFAVIDLHRKLEGICRVKIRGKHRIYAVNDEDKPEHPSELCVGIFSRRWLKYF